MPATIRHGLHREAGQRLARTGAPALQVAEHLARGVGVASAPVAGQPRRGQEAREPGAGSRKMRLRARSRTGAGSPLSTASRRESLPHR